MFKRHLCVEQFLLLQARLFHITLFGPVFIIIFLQTETILNPEFFQEQIGGCVKVWLFYDL